MKKKYLKLFNKPTIKALSSVQVIKDKRQADSGHCGKQKTFFPFARQLPLTKIGCYLLMYHV